MKTIQEIFNLALQEENPNDGGKFYQPGGYMCISLMMMELQCFITKEEHYIAEAAIHSVLADLLKPCVADPVDRIRRSLFGAIETLACHDLKVRYDHLEAYQRADISEMSERLLYPMGPELYGNWENRELILATAISTFTAAVKAYLEN